MASSPKLPKEVDLDHDPDDEQLEQTPPDVVEELGFDPLEEDFDS